MDVAVEGGEKTQVDEYGLQSKNIKLREWMRLVVRLLALCATVSATLVMALNKESKTIVVGTIGTSPVNATIKAKFQNTPAFVFFVIVNGVASFHNLLMLVLDLFGHKLNFKGLRLFLFTTLLDMGTIVLVSAAAGAATSMAELGKNGNSHARWNKICDKFEKYCDRGGGALIASYTGIAFMAALILLSLISLVRKAPLNS